SRSDPALNATHSTADKAPRRNDSPSSAAAPPPALRASHTSPPPSSANQRPKRVRRTRARSSCHSASTHRQVCTPHYRGGKGGEEYRITARRTKSLRAASAPHEPLLPLPHRRDDRFHEGRRVEAHWICCRQTGL